MARIKIVSIQNSLEIAAVIAQSVKGSRDMEITGKAADLQAGLQLAASSNPDIVLAYDDPTIVEFTTALLNKLPETGIIVTASGEDPATPKRIVAALTEGAFDFVTGLSTRKSIDGSETLSSLLLSKIRCCSIRRYSRIVRRESGVDHPKRFVDTNRMENRMQESIQKTLKPKFDVVLIGVSTGGPEALMSLLPALPEHLSAPILIVLHMPKEFTGPMAAALDRKTKIRVRETIDGEEVMEGKAYLARGGFHCTVMRDISGRIIFQSNDQPPENGCKPAVDVLFRSAAPLYGDRAIAVILTGMGSDGAQGCETVKKHGGIVLAQDESSSVVWGMPGSVVGAGLADEIVSLKKIPERLCALLGAKR
jgi:two-component system, chemotaxis family, protein-glutamate methylesterase/glutaminase